MLNLLRGETVRRVLMILPTELRAKFAHPKHPRPTADFVGTDEKTILSSLIMSIAYTEDIIVVGRERDGNILEPMSWIGLDENDYQHILEAMRSVGWHVNIEQF